MRQPELYSLHSGYWRARAETRGRTCWSVSRIRVTPSGCLCGGRRATPRIPLLVSDRPLELLPNFRAGQRSPVRRGGGRCRHDGSPIRLELLGTTAKASAVLMV